MSLNPTPAQFAFLTMPDTTPVLNIQIQGGEIQRFEITRDHLFALNTQIADALIRHKDRK